MIIHIVTDRFSLGGGIEHIFQLTSRLTDIQFNIYAEKGSVKNKFQNLDNVSTFSREYKQSDYFEGKPNLVHFHHIKPLFFFFIKNFTKQKQLRIIYTAHGLHIHKYEFRPGFLSKIMYHLRLKLEKKLYAGVSKIIAVSKADREYLIGKYNLKKEKIIYIPNGINWSKENDKCEDDRNKIRLDLGISPQKKCFITVARFNFQKGYDILLQAIQVFQHKYPHSDVLFLLVGDGEEFEKMKGLAAGLKDPSQIVFLGKRLDVYRLLKTADFFLLPSRWEGLPIGIIEAGFSKIPVIASDTYGNKELLAENRGILFKNLDVSDLAQKLRGVLSGKYDLEEIKNKLYQELLENYTLSSMVYEVKLLYSGLLNDISSTGI